MNTRNSHGYSPVHNAVIDHSRSALELFVKMGKVGERERERLRETQRHRDTEIKRFAYCWLYLF